MEQPAEELLSEYKRRRVVTELTLRGADIDAENELLFTLPDA